MSNKLLKKKISLEKSIKELVSKPITIEAWICVYPEEEVTCSPLIKFIKPLQREVKSDRKFGVKTYECKIIYRLKDELK